MVFPENDFSERQDNCHGTSYLSWYMVLYVKQIIVLCRIVIVWLFVLEITHLVMWQIGIIGLADMTS